MKRNYLRPDLELCEFENNVIMTSDAFSYPDDLGDGDWGVQDVL